MKSKKIKYPLLILLTSILIVNISCSENNKTIVTKKVTDVDDRKLGEFIGNYISEKDEKFKAIDYDGFENLTSKINSYRKERLVYLEDFKKLMTRTDVILLDTRSKKAYDQIHVKGAKHLNFSDFTEDKLAKVIPDKESVILIYCNNNFNSGFVDLLDKSPALALNIPTFINLYGYGYKNIYELYTPVKIDTQENQLEFAGKSIEGPI